MTTAIQPFTGVYELDQDHSSLQFAVKHMNVSSFRALLADTKARLVVDENGVTLEGSARADSVSIVSPPELREHIVRGDDFFAADDYPELTFRSTEVEFADDGQAAVTGELTIRDITRTVTADGKYQAPVEDPYGSYRTALELRMTVDRRAWDMSWQTPLPDGQDVLGWDVEITAHLELIRQG